jgi:outer membrane receptor protein involved in Fe transport
MNHPLLPLAAALGGLWLPLAALAQTAPAARVEIIGVSPLPGVGVPASQVPGNVQTLRAADIDASHALDLSSLMGRRLGSVHLNEIQNNPFQPDLNYRGYTASPLLGTQQGLSVYLDGVRMNQPFGDVVSWDLIPKAAIAGVTLMPGSNPLFGLNTLGGALAVQTKDGISHPGSSVQLLAGENGRVAAEFETGGSQAGGLHWYVTGQKFKEDGWRVDSPSDVGQLFAKLGLQRADTRLTLSAALADTDLNGNGLQEQRFLERDRASVYTKPDNTKNHAGLLNLAFTQGLGQNLSLTGNVYARSIRTRTYNGDINDDSFDQALYQPNANERAALTAAGLSGFPVSGETAANTPFPKWRCIANALLRDEPGEKCNGVINQTFTRQSQQGLAAQLVYDAPVFGLPSQLLGGLALDANRSHFTQGSELGYLNPDRSITGVGAFGDGVTGGDVDGEPYDTRVDLRGRTRTWSAYASQVLTLQRGLHLTLSGRYNRSQVKNRDAITPGGGTGSLDGDHRYSRFNPAIGLTFSPSPALNVYVGANQGSRAPSSIELGCADPESPCKLPNAFAGDPPLKQVVTTTLEAGVRGSIPGGFSWNAGVFRSDNKDDLLFVADDSAGFGYFRNFGKTRRQGLELGAAWQPSAAFNIGMNISLLDATYRSPEAVDGSSNSSNESAEDGFPGVDGEIDIHPGDRIPLLPRRMIKLFADWRINAQWALNLDVNSVGESLARGNENGQHEPDGTFYLGEGRSPAYTVVNLGLEWRPMPALKLFAQVNNLLDREYSTAAQLGPTGFNATGNFEARPFAANANGDRPVRHATFFAPGAPRTVWVGLKLSL